MTVQHIKPSNIADKGNLLLDIPQGLISVPDWLKNESLVNGYKEKPEYHVTIIGKSLADKISDLGFYDEVNDLISNYIWSIELTDTYIEIAKDDEEGIHRQAIIQLVIIPELNAFFDELEKVTKLSIARPPAHITLFTKNYDKGIGLYSNDDLSRYTIRKLSNHHRPRYYI